MPYFGANIIVKTKNSASVKIMHAPVAPFKK